MLLARLSALDVFLLLLGAYLVNAFRLHLKQRKLGQLPPGPMPWPLIGNLRDLPKSYDWLHWAKHKEKYGPLSTVSVFGRRLMFIHDVQIASDLFEKRSNIYSDRPSQIFFGDMVGWKHTLAFLCYGDRLRAYRRNLHQVIGTRAAITQFYPLVERETRRFLLNVMHSPEKLKQHIRTTSGAIILKLSHGYTIDHSGKRLDPLVELAEDAVGTISAGSMPGVALIDMMPPLRHLPSWMPFAGFQKKAIEFKRVLDMLTEKPHALVKQQMARGTAAPSLTSMLLEDFSPDEEQEFVIKWSAQSLYSAGSDTTVSGVYGFFLAMVLYPHVFQRAQAEIDEVIGNDRLPRFTDRKKLPYIDAIVKELLRWHTVTPMGLPHATSEDDSYHGYYIPKGTLLMVNLWDVMHDPERYHEPMVFKPERFLEHGVEGREPEVEPYLFAFGYGRRICPGKELADASLFLQIAMSIAVFDIGKAKDTTGRPIEVKPEFTSAVITHPKPFECIVAPRSERAVALIRAFEDDYPYEESHAAELEAMPWPA